MQSVPWSTCSTATTRRRSPRPRGRCWTPGSRPRSCVTPTGSRNLALQVPVQRGSSSRVCTARREWDQVTPIWVRNSRKNGQHPLYALIYVDKSTIAKCFMGPSRSPNRVWQEQSKSQLRSCEMCHMRDCVQHKIPLCDQSCGQRPPRKVLPRPFKGPFYHGHCLRDLKTNWGAWKRPFRVCTELNFEVNSMINGSDK